MTLLFLIWGIALVIVNVTSWIAIKELNPVSAIGLICGILLIIVSLERVSL